MNRRNWDAEEDEVLRVAVSIVGNEDWTKISNYIRNNCEIAQKTKRTGKQCRERWFNHLDPKINKNPWSEEEEQKLFQVHKTYGNKWKQISKYLPGRTDNDIKNHFYSTLRRSLRRLNKYIGEKNSTSHMREIRPSVLTIIINFIYGQENIDSDEVLLSLRELPELIFKFAAFKPVKNNMQKGVDQELKKKINIILRLVEQFNEMYHNDKGGHEKEESLDIKVEDIESEELEAEGKNKRYPRTIEPIITIRRRSSTMSDHRKKDPTPSIQKEEEIEAKHQESDEDFGMMHPFDEENIDGNIMPIEEPSLSMGLVIIGKHIQPIEYEVPREGVGEEGFTNIDEILYEHHD